MCHTTSLVATESTNGTRAAYAYLFPHGLTNLVHLLQRHGIEVNQLREDIDLHVRVYPIKRGRTSPPQFLVRQSDLVDGSGVAQQRRFTAGTVVVPANQKLGPLINRLLHPESQESLAPSEHWYGVLQDGGEFPVQILRQPTSLLLAQTPPPPEKRQRNRRVTFDAVYGKNKADFTGSPTRLQRWLEDGNSFLQERENRLWIVNALTGEPRPLFDPDVVATALQKLDAFDTNAARTVAERTRFTMNPDATGALIDHDNDLYYFRFDGTIAVRLTSTPEKEELAEFSPDGKSVAFVRSLDLHVVDIQTQMERALTTDGTGDIRNGKADWVYFEELYNRSWKAYWWSPNSRHIAFHRFDDSALPMFHALNTLPLHGELESMRHPKAGDPNPTVKLGIVSRSGGEIQWVDIENDYAPGAYIVSHVGWYPDSAKVYYHVQDRVQTWLDFNVWDLGTRRNERLFRDKTEAWIQSPGDAKFLKDGTFLTTSDRTGWNHMYHFEPISNRWRTITSGNWEVRQVHLADEQNGWIYFSGTRDSAIAEHLYRCKLDGTELERLTHQSGNHRVMIDPTGTFFVDNWSSFHSPEQARLYRTDGSLVRMLDGNPVHALDEFEFGESRLFQIESRDGFQLEAALVKPPDFSPDKKYPVWFMTYAGPHAPSIRDLWSARNAQDQILAAMGLIVFRMDPRSASGKGSASAWTAYRQLGVPELTDITEAIEWLKGHPFIDGDRIGMSGHSYGGFITAYALTHSKLFAAGIAGAPVTDWRYYDSIYTERYMDLPQNNPDGYETTSVVKAAKNLHGRLLLLHGMMDDNVHLQNATQWIHALQKAEKQFEVMFYPEMKHGLHGAHYNQLIVDFIRRTVLTP